MQRARGILGIWVVKNIDFHRRYGAFSDVQHSLWNYLSLHCKLFSDWFKSENSQKSRHRIFEKNPIFFRKRQDFLMIFPSMYTAYTMSHTHIYSPEWQLFSDWFKSENSQKSRHRILLYESCSLIGLNPGIPKNLGIEFTTCSSTYNLQFSDPLKLKKLTFPNPQKLYRYSPCISEYTSRKNHVFINRSY